MCLEQEIWRSVVGYKDYEVSSYGKIRSLKRSKVMLLSLFQNDDGYLTVNLMNNERKKKKLLVHRIVAFAFIENKNINFNDVNHKDCDKLNNYYKNLEWCTKTYNTEYVYKNKRKPKLKLTIEDVNKMFCLYKNEHKTLKSIAKLYNINTRELRVIFRYIHPDY